MYSIIALFIYTALVVLSYVFPDLTRLFLMASVVAVFYTHFRRRIFFLYRAGFYRSLVLILPLLFLCIVSINSSIGHLVLWVLYIFVLVFEYIIPTGKYLAVRLRLYTHIKRLIKKRGYTSDISIFKVLFAGHRTPYHILVKAPQKSITVGVLGAVSSSRYIFGRSTVISQKFGNGKAYMIEDIREIEKFEEDTEALFPRIGPSFLGRKHQKELPEIKECDKVILLIHPNSYVEENERILGLGETVGEYLLVSIKAVFNIIGD